MKSMPLKAVSINWDTKPLSFTGLRRFPKAICQALSWQAVVSSCPAQKGLGSR